MKLLTSEELEEIILRAQLRRERRLRVVMQAQGYFPNAATWRTLDLVHEATRLIDKLEDRAADAADHDAEKTQEVWDRIYA